MLTKYQRTKIYIYIIHNTSIRMYARMRCRKLPWNLYAPFVSFLVCYLVGANHPHLIAHFLITKHSPVIPSRASCSRESQVLARVMYLPFSDTKGAFCHGKDLSYICLKILLKLIWTNTKISYRYRCVVCANNVGFLVSTQLYSLIAKNPKTLLR